MIPGTCEEYPERRGHIGDEYIQYRKGNSRDRRDKNRRDYTPLHTQSDTEPELEDKEHISANTEAKIERSVGDRRETPEGRGKGPKTQLDSTQAILNDLARGQRDMMNATAQMAINTQMIHHSVSTIGANPAGGASGSRGHGGGGVSGSSGSQGGASTYYTLFTSPSLHIVWEDSSTFIATVPGRTSIGTARACGRTARPGTGSATGSIRGVQERLLGTRTRVPCRHEFVRLLFDHISKQTQGGKEGQWTNSQHGLHQESGKAEHSYFR
jgi:hypothetical protein